MKQEIIHILRYFIILITFLISPLYILGETVIENSFTVTFHIHNAQDITISNIPNGTAIDEIDGVPTNITYNNENIAIFVGWTMAPNTLDDKSNPGIVTTITQNCDLYPVFLERYGILLTNLPNVGDSVIIAATEYNVAMSTKINKTYINANPITKENNKIYFDENTLIFTIEQDTTHAYLFKNKELYLYFFNRQITLIEKSNKYTKWNLSINNSTKISGKEDSNIDGTYLSYNNNYFTYGSSANVSLYKVVNEWIVCEDSELIIAPNTTTPIDEDIHYDKIIIKSDKDNSGEINIQSATISTDKISLEKTIDASRYYFFSLPFPCNINNLTAQDNTNGTPLIYYDDYTIFYYDQKVASDNNGAANTNAWREITETNTVLTPNRGYIVGYLKDSGEATITFSSNGYQSFTLTQETPLDFLQRHDTSHEDYIWYTHGEVETANGWNLIGMPYFKKPEDSQLEPNYVTMPNDDGKTYTQTTYEEASISPLSSFFVQLSSNTAPTFYRATNSNIARFNNQQSSNKITINISDSSYTDKTTIINNPNSTNRYEIGHDLIKWIGYADRPQIYSIQDENILAFNSINISQDTITIIPIGLYIPKEQTYNFTSINNTQFDIHLFDKLDQNKILLSEQSYGILLKKGKYENRFEIHLSQKTPSNYTNTNDHISIYTNHEQLNIANLPLNATINIYNLQGQLLYTTTNNMPKITYELKAKGIYLITIKTKDSFKSFKIFN